MGEDYYKILEVEKTATQEEIKKSYKKLAMKHHPDKGGDVETMRKINEAYDTLGDPDKRNRYDNPHAFVGGEYDINDIFQHFFSGAGGPHGPFGGFKHGNYSNVYFRGSDLKVHLNITTRESYFGTERTIKYKRFVNGKTTEETKKISIPQNCDNGTILRMRGGGNAPQQNNGEDKPEHYGDLLVVILLQEDNFFKSDFNLVTKVNVDAVDLIIGKEVLIHHYDGDLKVNVPANVNPHKILRIPGKGFKTGRRNGDLMIELNVVNDSLNLPEEIKKKLYEFKHSEHTEKQSNEK